MPSWTNATRFAPSEAIHGTAASASLSTVALSRNTPGWLGLSRSEALAAGMTMGTPASSKTLRVGSVALLQ